MHSWIHSCIHAFMGKTLISINHVSITRMRFTQKTMGKDYLVYLIPESHLQNITFTSIRCLCPFQQQGFSKLDLVLFICSISSIKYQIYIHHAPIPHFNPMFWGRQFIKVDNEAGENILVVFVGCTCIFLSWNCLQKIG